MGFDVFGTRAVSKKGKYFHNSVWDWRPLANYVLNQVVIPENDAASWHLNLGYEVSEASAVKIAETLELLIAAGYTARYEKDYEETLASLLLETCELCKGTGLRNDGSLQQVCTGCRGRGQREAWETYYPFTTQNVKNFAQFCRDSGGFEIC